MRSIAAFSVAAALAVAGAAHAQAISPGGSLTGVSIAGNDAIYQIFGHTGDITGDNVAGTANAHLVTFSAGSGNTFTFSATGEIGCCGGLDPGFTPDGAAGVTNINGANGLSGLSGNSLIPLVGVFTTDTDPFGGAAPSALVFNAASPTSLSPTLNQVFYIGDGLSGFNNAAGTALNFTAPTTATRLYIGVIDGFSFVGNSGFYADNPGSFTVNVNLAGSPVRGVPEPGAWAMMLLGVFGAGALIRRRRRRPIAAAA